MSGSDKTKRFQELLRSNDLSFLLEAHNGISARIGEEAGFQGLWASGLCISAQYGIRDNNEASWTQVLDTVEFMADATTIPIMLDGDTGYGNFNSMRRLVRKLEQVGVAAVCIEDKLFPKTNSFIASRTQPLADIEEFSGKIRAGKDAQTSDDFAIVARVEAFIAGWGLDEALRRAHAYADAGADAILIHSALDVPDEVLSFKREWDRDTPVVIVPTKYYQTPTDVFRDAGFSVVIWANHILRAAVAAMQQAAELLVKEQRALSLEESIVPVSEIFRLQNASELKEAEKIYLPATRADTKAILLAAARGAELGDMTESLPKALVPVDGRPLIRSQIDAFNAVGIRDITVTRGYRKDAFDIANLHYVDNDEYMTTGEVKSLEVALEATSAQRDATVVVCYGDVLFDKSVPQKLLETDRDLAVAVDTDWHFSANKERDADLVRCSVPFSRGLLSRSAWLERIWSGRPDDRTHGEWTGFLKIEPGVRQHVLERIRELLSEESNRMMGVPALLDALLADGQRIEVVYTTGGWLDVDSLADVERAQTFGATG